MKKILLLAAMIMSFNTAFSQTADKIFEKISKDNKEVKCIELDKDMLAMVAAEDKDKNSEFGDVLKKIDNMKLMDISDEDIIGEMRLMLPELEKNGYKLLLSASDEGNTVSVYTLPGKKNIKELFLIAQEGSKGCKLILFKGNIDPKSIEKLASFGSDDD